MNITHRIEEASEALRSALGDRRPRVGLILGSGLTLQHFPLDEAIVVPVADIPHLPQPRVEGHSAEWVAARLGGVEVLVAGGRCHAYEGEPLWRSTLGVRVMRSVGCSSLVVTNAAGGVAARLRPGTIMRIRDHLNLLGDSPLVGEHHESLGARFVDMSFAYDPEWWSRVAPKAAAAGIEVAQGVYAACLGPQYETPAEVRMLGLLGADAVGMSTVPEVIVAQQVGLSVFGISLISNLAAGIADRPLSHEEVIETGRASSALLARLLEIVVAEA